MTISKDLDKDKVEYKVIGTRPIRHDGTDKVTGRALYGADYYPTGLIYGKVLRSPHAHANIKSIDTSLNSGFNIYTSRQATSSIINIKL